ncbi:MAG TPA: hypothetical protein VGI20_06455 [Rhizomicrobium sp.]|jgi:hypothetical protein
MASISSEIAVWIDSASFWEAVVICDLVLFLVAALAALCVRWVKFAAWLLVAASAIALVATVMSNNINDRTIANLENQAQQAVKLAGTLGVKLDTLHDFVEQKERQADTDVQKLQGIIDDEKKRDAAVIKELGSSKTDLEKARSDVLAAAKGTKKDLVDITSLLANERAVRQQIMAAIKLRELTPDAARRVVGKVKPFGPVTFDQGIVAFDDTLFLQELSLEVWPQCGWKNEGSISAAAIPLLEGSKGIRVLYDAAHSIKLKGPATTFAKALSDENIPSTAEAIGSDPRLDADKIHVFIGSR